MIRIASGRLHTIHAVFRDEEGRLIARAEQKDGTLYEFQIKAFEILEPGKEYSQVAARNISLTSSMETTAQDTPPVNFFY